MSLIRLALALAVLVSLGGCASIIAPGPDDVHVTSSPSGATIEVEGVAVGQTPATVEIERDTAFVRLTMDGYAETAVPVPREMNPWIWANLLIGGIPGLIVDGAYDNHQWARGTVHGTLRKHAARRLGIGDRDGGPP